MTRHLLSATAKSLNSRTEPVIALTPTYDHRWLTKILETTCSDHHKFKTFTTRKKRLLEILSKPWILCSIMLPETQDSEHDWKIVHIEGQIIHVDSKEMSFKLTTESIDELVDYHKTMFKAGVYSMEAHNDFVKHIHDYLFFTSTEALEGLDENGSSELLREYPREVKTRIEAILEPQMEEPSKHPPPNQCWTPPSSICDFMGLI